MLCMIFDCINGCLTVFLAVCCFFPLIYYYRYYWSLLCFCVFFCCSAVDICVVPPFFINWVKYEQVPVAKIKIINKMIEFKTLKRNIQIDGREEKNLQKYERFSFIIGKYGSYYHNKAFDFGRKSFISFYEILISSTRFNKHALHTSKLVWPCSQMCL